MCSKCASQSIKDLDLGFGKMDLNPVFRIWNWNSNPTLKRGIGIIKIRLFCVSIPNPKIARGCEKKMPNIPFFDVIPSC